MAGVRARMRWGVVAMSCAGALAFAGSALADGTDEQGDPAHDGVVTSETVTAPLTKLWSVTLDGLVTYPVVVVGTQAYALTSDRLEAINDATGAVEWTDDTGGVGLTYDDGQLFTVDNGGLLVAINATSGDIAWSTQLPGQYMFTAAPTATGGIVYVGGAGSGGTLYAVSEANGSLLWSQPVENGDESSPTVSGGDVYVTYPGQYYAFDATTGAPVWHISGSIEGGGGWTPVAAEGNLYVLDPDTSSKILSAASGATEGPLDATQMPAVDGSTVYEITGSVQNANTTLDAVSDGGLGPVSWSFTGGASLDTAPLVIGSTVWVGSSSGMLYGIDAATGQAVWSTDAGAAINPADTTGDPLGGLASANNELIVPAGDTLIGYESATGLASSGAPAAPPVPSAPAGPAVGGSAAGSVTTGASASATERHTAVIRLGAEIAAPQAVRTRLLAGDRVGLTVKAPSAGRLRLRWTVKVRSGGHTRAVRIASLSHTFGRAATAHLTLRLTAAGRRTLRRAGARATVDATARFTPAHGRRMVVHRSFRLLAS